MFKYLTLAFLAFASPVVATPAQCGPSAKVYAILAEKYKETRQTMAMTSDDTILEIFASEDGSTWTALITNPIGQSCLVAAGSMYNENPPQVVPAPNT